MKQPSVLIIEDDTWFAEQQTRILQKAGYTVRHVTNGLEGIEAIDDMRPDVIVLDMLLPGPNALVLLHEIQSHADLSSLPVIICTSASAQLSSEALAAYGVTDVLDKADMAPVDIVAAIRRALL